MEKYKEVLQKILSEKKNVVLIICSFVAIILLLFSELSSEDNEKENSEPCMGIAADEYIEIQEEKLEKLLESIDGAGNVEVMITLESCYENVYLKDSAVKTESNESDFSKEQEDKYIITKNTTNDQGGLIIKVYEPVVKGVAVVAEGGDNEKIKMAVLETVSAVFNINSSNISVEKMNPERNEE